MALQSWYRDKYPLGLKEWTPERVADYRKYTSEINSRPRPRRPRTTTRCPNALALRKHSARDKRRQELRRSAEAYLAKRKYDLSKLK
jgi:hypothetical protein